MSLRCCSILLLEANGQELPPKSFCVLQSRRRERDPVLDSVTHHPLSYPALRSPDTHKHTAVLQ